MGPAVVKKWILLLAFLLAGCVDADTDTNATPIDAPNQGAAPPEANRDGDSSPPSPSDEGGATETERPGLDDVEYQYSGRFFLHATEDRLWTDRATEGSTTDVDGTTWLVANEWHRFEHTEAFMQDVVLQADHALLKLHVSQQASINGDVDIQARLNIGQHTASGSMQEGWIALALPDGIPAGAKMSLEVCVCPASPASYTGYTIATDGRSWLDIPYE